VRVLVTIPHVYDPTGDPRYGACQPDPAPRIFALTACINRLRHDFDPVHRFINHALHKIEVSCRAAPPEVDIVVCTTGDLHVLDHLRIPVAWYEQRPSAVDPMLVGFECHEVLRERLGDYDVYCYLEDDIAIHDAALLDKLSWFVETFGPSNALGAHRYEIAATKLYVDGDIPEAWTIEAQDTSVASTLSAEVFGRPITFTRPLNPNAGCFFLTGEQMAHWAAQPYFLDRDTRFVGPIESAANFGIMRAFRLYKPAPPHAAFFEVEHLDTKWFQWAQTTCDWSAPAMSHRSD
jgi:hypothetical protein